MGNSSISKWTPTSKPTDVHKVSGNVRATNFTKVEATGKSVHECHFNLKQQVFAVRYLAYTKDRYQMINHLGQQWVWCHADAVE